MLRAEKTVVFASDYPHWDFDNPLTAFNFFPRRDLKRRIFVDNALDLYGPRLLASHAELSEVTTSNGRTNAPRPAVIDVDLHHQITDWSAVAPVRRPRGCATASTRQGGPPMARHGFKPVGAASARPRRGRAGRPGGDPAGSRQQYLDTRGVDRAILTGPILSLGVQPNADMAAAVARGGQRLDARRPGCARSTASRARSWSRQQDPAQAVAEIDRLGDDPGMVQVLMGSASETPLGRRSYHPIYEACVRHGLPLALHLGGEGAGMSPPATAVGHPSDVLRVVRRAAAESTWRTS